MGRAKRPREWRLEPGAPLRERAAAGAAICAAVLGGIGVPVLLLLILLGGPEHLSRRSGTVWRLDLLLVLYPLGAAAGGAVAGALLPLARRLPGAVAVGALAAAPFMAAISVGADRGWEPWTGRRAAGVAAMSALFGGPVGWAAVARARRPGRVRRKPRGTGRVPPPAP